MNSSLLFRPSVIRGPWSDLDIVYILTFMSRSFPFKASMQLNTLCLQSTNPRNFSDFSSLRFLNFLDRIPDVPNCNYWSLGEFSVFFPYCVTSKELPNGAAGNSNMYWEIQIFFPFFITLVFYLP